MTLREAITVYINHRRSEGAQGAGAEMILQALCRRLEEIDLKDIHANQISTFVNNPRTASVTRISKFSVVRCFLDYYSARQLMPPIALEKPPRRIAPRFPLIYTRSQIHALLKATKRCKEQLSGLDGATFRSILLVLYTTGMTVDEVLTLRQSGVNIKSKQLSLEGTFSRPARNLPIGRDLRTELKNYRDTKNRPGEEGALFFRRRDGQPIKQKNLRERLECLCRMAAVGVSQNGHSPRLQDFRYTFAVHRITDWVRQGAKLNVLLPALSTYMGYANLTKAEQFLTYVPERFRKDLHKLSPAIGLKHWRNEPELMKFLSSR